ncbi:hypothetical protein PXJ20_23155 [Paraburkholderia sp. A1RI_3L]|uniref:hypothetical protein n=1 Tax=Paraburkholderia TaxID=1822464 RepID=UPI003B7ABC05
MSTTIQAWIFSINGESVDMFRVLFLHGNFYAPAFAGRFALPCREFTSAPLRFHVARFSMRIATLIEIGRGAFPRMSRVRSRRVAFARRMDFSMSLRS